MVKIWAYSEPKQLLSNLQTKCKGHDWFCFCFSVQPPTPILLTKLIHIIVFEIILSVACKYIFKTEMTSFVQVLSIQVYFHPLLILFS